MVRQKDIQKIARQIVDSFKPRMVVLFGSYAKGTPTQDSDVDLLVVTEHDGSSIEKAVQMRLQLRTTFPVDILVRTPEKVRQRLEMGDPFMKEIFEQGLVLYDAR